MCDVCASIDDGAKVVAILYRIWGLRNQREPSLRARAIRGLQGPKGEVLTAILKAYVSFDTVVQEHRPLLKELSSVPYHLATVEALGHYDLTSLTDAGRHRLLEFVFDEVLKQRMSAEEDVVQAMWIQKAETLLNGDHGAIALDAFSMSSNAQQNIQLPLSVRDKLSLSVASAYAKKLLAGQSSQLNVNLFLRLAVDSSTYLRMLCRTLLCLSDQDCPVDAWQTLSVLRDAWERSGPSSIMGGEQRCYLPVQNSKTSRDFDPNLDLSLSFAPEDSSAGGELAPASLVGSRWQPAVGHPEPDNDVQKCINRLAGIIQRVGASHIDVIVHMEFLCKSYTDHLFEVPSSLAESIKKAADELPLDKKLVVDRVACCLEVRARLI
jgi:hypothetical protein